MKFASEGWTIQRNLHLVYREIRSFAHLYLLIEMKKLQNDSRTWAERIQKVTEEINDEKTNLTESQFLIYSQKKNSNQYR